MYGNEAYLDPQDQQQQPSTIDRINNIIIMPSATDPTPQQPRSSAHPPPPPPPPDLSRILPKLTPRRRQASKATTTTTTNAQPVPTAPPLPTPPPSSCAGPFLKPVRRILSPRDLELFVASPTYGLLLSFVFSLSDSVRDCPVSSATTTTTIAASAAAAAPTTTTKTAAAAEAATDTTADKDADKDSSRDDEDEGGGEISETVQKVLEMLDEVEGVVRRCPAEDEGGSRFGNRGFRTFLDAVAQEQGRWHQELVPVPAEAVDEVSTYLLQSFGNRTRIDYGSGHELNFVVWLLCLYQLRLITPPDFRAVVLLIFARYLSLMRLIQSTYYLEPAGSHGVWGLDDYQFLPFLFGASQLVHHPYIRPLSIHNALVLEQHAKDYLYLGQVAFVNSVKNVEGLRWHSPMLDDISAAKSWAKVEAGMRRMFVAEVLKKLPVMQHFLFGSLVPAVNGMSQEKELGLPSEEDETEGGEVQVMRDGMRHVHQSNSWGDCCGIKVPSSIAAAQEMKKSRGDIGLRRVPFD